MKTPLSPSLLLESGQIFAFGGMGQDLMDAPTPSTLSHPIQQTSSPGDCYYPGLVICYIFRCLPNQESPLLFPPGQHGAFSLCEVCNLQLTSTAQAQLHYNGRSHLRRVRQLQAGEAQQQAAGALMLKTELRSLSVISTRECYFQL